MRAFAGGLLEQPAVPQDVTQGVVGVAALGALLH